MKNLISSCVRYLCLLVLLSTVIGCGEQPEPARLDSDIAREAVTQFLETWKRGGTPKELQAATPSIIVGEPEWEAGNKLAKFQVLKDKERQDGVNLHATVQLTTQSSKGRKSQSEVTYIVGTKPVITIHRK